MIGEYPGMMLPGCPLPGIVDDPYDDDTPSTTPSSPRRSEESEQEENRCWEAHVDPVDGKFGLSVNGHVGDIIPGAVLVKTIHDGGAVARFNATATPSRVIQRGDVILNFPNPQREQIVGPTWLRIVRWGWEVTLHRPDTRVLVGIQVSLFSRGPTPYRGPAWLQVSIVRPGLLFEEWNYTNKDKSVRPGDFVLQLNGHESCCKSIDEFTEEVSKTLNPTFFFLRVPDRVRRKYNDW